MRPPQDDLFELLHKHIKKIPEQSVLVITSKIVSIHQGRCVLQSEFPDKEALIRKEAQKYLPGSRVEGKSPMLTIKNNILIPTAGIDESNAGKYYILWPRQPRKTAQDLYQFIKKEYRVKKVGVIISDSHTVPMRRGVLGIAVSYYGFRGLNDYRGTKDLYGRKLEVSTVNVADALATAAVLEMGEGKEQTPLALINDIPFVQFISRPDRTLSIGIKEDLYGPLLKSVKWKSKSKRA